MPNITIPVSNGIINHGNPKLLCFHPEWYDYVLFYLGNYVAHVATILLEPGLSTYLKSYRIFLAMAFPLFGMARAINIFILRPIFAENPLQRAAKAGALCMVLRKSDVQRLSKLRDGEPEASEIGAQNAEPEESQSSDNLKKWWKGGLTPCKKLDITHGSYDLPPTHDKYHVPPHTPVCVREGKMSPVEISSSYNLARIIVSLCQLAFSITTLYRARGDQIHQYGYTAFGLTVLPYAWMSFLNLVGSFLTPTYQTLYVLWTPELEEVREYGVDGTVGKIDMKKLEAHDFDLRTIPWNRNLKLCVLVLLALVPFAILGAMTGFDVGHSTLAVRVWITSWLVVSVVSPALIGIITNSPRLLEGSSRVPVTVLALAVLLVSFTPVIGGFIMVGKMFREFGVCTLVR